MLEEKQGRVIVIIFNFQLALERSYRLYCRETSGVSLPLALGKAQSSQGDSMSHATRLILKKLTICEFQSKRMHQCGIFQMKIK